MKQIKIYDLPIVGKFIRIPSKNQSLTYPGGLEFHSNLKAMIKRSDGRTEEFDFGSGVVTTAGVAFMANDFANITPGTNDITTFNYHDSGTGAVAAAIGDTGVTAGGPARVAGTQTSPAGGQYRSVATISYTTTLAITEWGLFSASTAGTLWDRKVFSAINVANGDSIQFTYTLTINSGG